jgi:hypothetical protein
MHKIFVNFSQSVSHVNVAAFIALVYSVKFFICCPFKHFFVSRLAMQWTGQTSSKEGAKKGCFVPKNG